MARPKAGAGGHYDQYESLLEQYEETGSVEHLHGMFRLLDLDGDGLVSKEELLIFYRTRERENEASKAARAFMKLGDTNHDGLLEENEFIALFTQASNLDIDESGGALSATDEECKRHLDAYERTRDDRHLHSCFQTLDINKDGVISKSELKSSYLCRGASSEDAARFLMQLGDANSDGVLSIDEFVQLIKQSFH